jgi:hypothetical protein
MPRLAGGPLRGVGYHPRHRSPRWDKADQRILADLPPVIVAPPVNLGFSADESWLSGDGADSDFLDDFTNGDDSDFLDELANGADSDFLDDLTRGQIRRILEGSAINDNRAKAVPELASLVAHSSHTSVTLASAWADFQQATRDAYALRVGRRAWWELFRPHDLGSSPQADAIEIELSLADDAWYLITNGEPS